MFDKLKAKFANKDTKWLPYLKNKYVIASLIFIVWIGFIDENNLIERIQMKSYYNSLLKSKRYYKDKIETDRYEMEELENNSKLERLARERYLMRKTNEDIIIIKTEED